jgi:predicted enzyme related to lactoylglutathione lyase
MTTPKIEVGSLGWTDLTVPDADRIRDFYIEVVGWKPEPVDMGGYSDYTMTTAESGTAVAGVCHARGSNVGLPAKWLIYITVSDIDASIARCSELGGRVVLPAKGFGGQGRYCVIEDPAGAVVALFEPASG